ncbi:GFA family protein [Roseovarius sp. A21]|uniref:GFA family protein n=1 Tax=Roseovarius bejariae TaxID=2576383 RepID=A0A844CVV3_9RHOB|nr:GFA family protein [Roseovarius bejariae]MRU15286.1 GFA family protein [Roseovarius bejariae]
MSNTLKGQCFCGAVEIEVTGEPAGMGYCHCESCRAWSAGPVNAFTLWPPDNVKVVKGEEHIRQFNKTENSDRKWCNKCGGHLMAGHPGLGLTDVYAAIIPNLEFKPGIHVNYAETVLPMKDGLPKMKDFPSEFGGSGETVPE